MKNSIIFLKDFPNCLPFYCNNIESISTLNIICLSSLTEMLLNLDKANVWVLGHGEVSIDETDEDNPRVEEECSVEAKPVDELGEELGEGGGAH